MSGSKKCRNTPTRRSILSLFAAALVAGWLGLVRRSKVGFVAAEPFVNVAAPDKPVPLYCFRAELGNTEAGSYTAEPVRTLAESDEQDRLVRYTDFLPDGRTEVHTYDVPNA